RNFTRKTMINKRQEYKQLLEYLQTKRGIDELESVTSHDLKSYVRQKQIRGLKPQSIVSTAKQVKAFFNWCVKEEYLTENPMEKVTLPKVPKVLLTGLTTKEVVAMMDSFNNKEYLEIRNKTILALMADCGLRSMEVAGLKDIDVRDMDIKVYGKGNKERIVFISPALKKILIRYERAKKKYFKDRIKYNDNYFLAYQGKTMSTVA